MLGSAPHRSRTGMLFAAFTVVSLLLLLTSRTPQAIGLQQASARALDPIRSAIAAAGQGIGGIFSTVGEIDRLRADNGQLQRDLAASQQRVASLQEAASENATLRALLGLRTKLAMTLIPARIISRDPSNFTWEVGIDVGTDAGVRVGMPVVASATDGSGALVGAVITAEATTARVRFAVDSRFSVVAVDQQTRALGEVQGQLGGQLMLVNVPRTEKVQPGDTVVTAGLSLGSVARSPYPKGLLIGTVQAVQPDANALTQTAFVRPAVDVERIERLMVVTHFSGG